MKPLSILSAAVLTPWGSDASALLRRLEAKTDPGAPPRRVPDEDLAAAAGVAPSYRDRAASLLLGVARRALAGAGIGTPVPSPERFGLVTGSHRGPLDSYALFLGKIREAGPRLAPPLLFAHGYPNAPNTLASIALGIRGPNLAFSRGRVSGLSALVHAAIQIDMGRADLALAAAFEPVPEAWAATPMGEFAVAVLLASEGKGPRLLAAIETGGPDPAVSLAAAAAEAMLRAGVPGVRGILASLPPPRTSASLPPPDGGIPRLLLEDAVGDGAGAPGLLGAALAFERVRSGGEGPLLAAASDEDGSAAAALIG